MQGRRKFNRCKLEQKTRRVIGLSGQQKDGLLLDISVGGMRIILDREPGLGSQLSGQFKIIPQLDPFYVAGVVVWVKLIRIATTPRWEVGVKFTQVSTIPI